MHASKIAKGILFQFQMRLTLRGTGARNTRVQTFRRGKTTSLWALRRSLENRSVASPVLSYTHMSLGGFLGSFFSGLGPARVLRTEDQQEDPDDAEQYGPQTMVQDIAATVAASEMEHPPMGAGASSQTPRCRARFRRGSRARRSCRRSLAAGRRGALLPPRRAEASPAPRRWRASAHRRPTRRRAARSRRTAPRLPPLPRRALRRAPPRPSAPCPCPRRLLLRTRPEEGWRLSCSCATTTSSPSTATCGWSSATRSARCRSRSPTRWRASG